MPPQGPTLHQSGSSALQRTWKFMRRSSYLYLLLIVPLTYSLCIHMYIYMAVPRDRGLSRTPLLLQTFVAGHLLQTLVAGLCVEYCSLQQACRKEGLSQDPPILLQGLSQKGRRGLLQARCVLRRCHIYIYIYIGSFLFTLTVTTIRSTKWSTK